MNDSPGKTDCGAWMCWMARSPAGGALQGPVVERDAGRGGAACRAAESPARPAAVGEHQDPSRLIVANQREGQVQGVGQPRGVVPHLGRKSR